MAAPAQEAIPPPLSREELSFFQKGVEKCKQQPLVPLGAFPRLPRPSLALICLDQGAAVTTWALLSAVREFKRGNSKNVNRYLRFRVVAQGATVAAMLIGSYVYEKSVAEQKEQEKIADRERMHRILDALGDGKPQAATLAPIQPTVESASEPVTAVAATPTLSGAVKSEKRAGPTRYTGSDDKLMEFFNRKRAEKEGQMDGSSPKSPFADEQSAQGQTDAKASGGSWIPWSGAKN